MLYDTHAHLNQPRFADDLPDVLSRAEEAGIEAINVIGVDVASSRACLQLAHEHAQLHAVIGIQPNDVGEVQPGDWDEIVRLAGEPGVVGIGETGLDRYWDATPIDQQRDYFDRHLRLSQSTGLAFVIHMRECEEDVLTMLREARSRGPLRGVMHSFTGTLAGAAEAVELGLYVSFAGMLTFKKSDELREVAKSVPLERLLVETDAPYLSPEPVRKIKRNEPAHVAHTARHLAEVRGERFEELARQTTANAKALFTKASE